MTELPEHSWVRTDAELTALAQRMRDAAWVALDSESNSMFAYRERVCLLQLNVAGALFLVDTLALAGDSGEPRAEALAALAEPLASPSLRLWIHGGEYDVACLKRDFGIELGGLFDTQQAASFLGWSRTGYAAVVEAVCEQKLPKAHKQHDWGRRPIDAKALRYALDDVVHLPRVGRELEARIGAADLDEELAIANASVAAAPAHRSAFDPSRMWKLKGARDLPAERLPVLAAIYRWREDKGRELDHPPGRLIANEPLVHLARRAPRDAAALKRMRLRRGFIQSHGEGLLAAIAAGLEGGDPLAEVPPKPKRERPPSSQVSRASRLKDWRRAEAEAREVPMQVVLPPRALNWLAAHGAAELEACPDLGPKRIARYGDQLRERCHPKS